MSFDEYARQDGRPWYLNWKVIVILCVLAVSFFQVVNWGIPENGSHTGYITETGYSGLIFKTHFIKMVSSKFGYGDKGNVWTYGITESSGMNIFNTAKTYQNDSFVTIDYECKLFYFVWEQDSSCVVTGIRLGGS